jgi:hypothetical protein
MIPFAPKPRLIENSQIRTSSKGSTKVELWLGIAFFAFQNV